MFIPIIATVVMLLVILAFMSSSVNVVNATEIKMAFEKVKYSFSTEKVIFEAVENLCQKNPVLCQSKYIDNKITLSSSDLVGYIPVNFDYTNLIGGVYSGIQIIDNNTTIRITHNVPSTVSRNVYLNHYSGKEFGISPKCVSGVSPCDSEFVYHDYPTSLYTRSALE